MSVIIGVQSSRLRTEALRVARSNFYSEEERNNDGPFIRAMGGKPGQEWCALFAGYCYRRACAYLSLPAPEWAFRRPGVPEQGAKRLVNNLAKQSGAVRFLDPMQALPGDLVCWHRRTGPISWQGHVALVESIDSSGIIHTIEGNVGAFPARVKRLSHDVRKERLYTFAGLRG